MPTRDGQKDGGDGGGGMEIGGSVSGATAGRVPYFAAGPVLADAAALTFTAGSGLLSATLLKATGLTAGRVPIVSTAGLLADDAELLYDATSNTLTAGALQATGLTSGRLTLAGASGLLGDTASLAWNSGTSVLTVSGKISGLTQATASGDAVHAGRTLTAGTGISAIGNLTADRTIALDLTATLAWTGVHTWSNAATPVKSTITDAAAAAQLEAARVAHTTSTTATAGIGAHVTFGVENGSGNEATAGQIGAMLRTVTDTTENGVIYFSTPSSGALAFRAHIGSGGIVNGTSGIGIGTLSATGTTTNTALWTVANSMVTHNSAANSQGGHQFTGTANASGARQFFVITPSANTGSTAGTEVQKFEYQAYTHQFASNTAVTAQREFCLKAPTYAFASATGTITDAALLYLDRAPQVGTNAAITNPWAVWVDADDCRFDGRVLCGAPDSAIADAKLQNSQFSFYLNEAGNALTVKVKYAAGTVKTGTIALT